jgi:hypothetical protein
MSQVNQWTGPKTSGLMRSEPSNSREGCLFDHELAVQGQSRQQVGRRDYLQLNFRTTDDQAAVIQAIGAQSHQKATRQIKPFAKYKYPGDLMPVGYDRAIAFGISVLPNVNINGTMGRFLSRCTSNFTRFLHEHGLTVSNAIPLLAMIGWRRQFRSHRSLRQFENLSPGIYSLERCTQTPLTY